MDRPTSERGWRPALVVLALLVVAAGCFRVYNLDIPLHARTGAWIVEHGAVPTTNVMAPLHADHPSVHDKWGFQVLAHLLLDGLGPDAVIAARIAVMLLLFGVLAATARRLGASAGATLLALTVALVAARSRFLFRPDLLSLLALAVVLRLVLVGRPGRRTVGALLLLQVLWVNLHGFFLLGYLTVLLVGGVHLLVPGEPRRAGRRLVAAGLGMAVVCLLNPAGLDGWLHPYRILSDLFAHRAFYTGAIEEFLPTFAADPRGPWDRRAYLLLLLGAVLLAALQLVRAWRRRATAGDGGAALARALVAAALVLVFGLMSRDLRRNMAPFAVVAAPLVAADLTSRLGRRVPGLLLPTLLALVVALGELTDRTSVHDGLERRTGLGRSQIAYPDAGIAFIAEQLPTLGVFTAFRFGSAFTGARWPEQAASTNGNTHGYPTAWLEDVLAATASEDPVPFARLAAAHDLDAALLPMASPLSVALLRSPDWTLVCLGRREAVYVLAAAVDPAWLEAHDLERDLADGVLPPLPRTPAPGTLLGLPKATFPYTEFDGASLLAAAGFPRPALPLAREAAELAPDAAEVLALAGLLEHAVGDPERGRELLRRSLEGDGPDPLAAQARAVLAGD